MLIAIQVFTKSPPEILTRILGPRMVVALEDSVEDLIPRCAERILKVLSAHLAEIGIQHRIFIYESLDAPNIIFMRQQDPFPQDLASRLVSLLASQDFVPPLAPPEPFQDYFYDF